MAVSSSVKPGRSTAITARVLSRAHRVCYVRDLLFVLVSRDMKLRYKRSMLGVLWTLLNPLGQLLILSFVFRSVLPLNIPRYDSFLFCGLLAWTWFSTALSQATAAIVENRELLKRPGFPIAILPTVTVTSHLIHFLLALPVLGLFLVLDGSRITSAMLALPLVMALQFIWTLSLAYLLATFHVTFRDTQYLLGVLLQLLFYLTPIFYEISAIPAPYQALYRLNPMMHIIDAYRAILLHGKLPEHVASLGVLGLLAIGLLIFGYGHFTRVSYRFVEEV
jgi:lipopolysaccharide transport system permease protein